jgi:hypothetical protein
VDPVHSLVPGMLTHRRAVIAPLERQKLVHGRDGQ